MCAEVGLLTRNIVIRGDKDTKETNYGAHTMLHGNENDGALGRISYAEFYDVG